MSTTSKKRKHSGDDAPAPAKFYAVRAGKTPGVYKTWAECQANTVGFKGASYKSFPTQQLALDFVNGKAVKNDADMKKTTKFYAVAVGHNPGVYTEWTEAQEQVTNVKGPKYKKFETRGEAEAFVMAGGRVVKPVAKVEGEAKGSKKKKVVGEAAEPAAKKVKKSASKNGKEKKVVVYTDGSSRGNGKVGALAGVGVYFGDYDERNVSEPLEGSPQTNQRAELTAILRALQIVPLTQDMEIITDSNYSINCCTVWYKSWVKNDWKTSTKGEVMNKDLIVEIRKIMDGRDGKGVSTQFTWIKGHSEDPGNEAADRLAVAGAMGER